MTASTQAPGGRTSVTLPGVPALGGLYARGVLSSGRLAVTRAMTRAPGALPEVTYTVTGVRPDAEHLTAYQHLLGESASDVLPAGFVHALAFPLAMAVMVRRDFPLPVAGMVHLANHVEQRVPLTLGDTLEVRAWAQGLARHRAGTQVDLVAEVRVAGSEHDGLPGLAGIAGAPAWRGVSTYLAKGVRLPDTGPGRTPETQPGEGEPGGRAAFVPPLPTGRWQLAADTGRLYAAVSGDRNPIHLSALSAKALGFPRAIAHGMYTAARALADVGPARGDAFTWTVEFAKPVLLPGRVEVRVAPDGAGGYGYAAWDGRTGKPHLTGAVRPL